VSFVERILDAFTQTEAVDEVVGIVVFGSVARGTADRQSDIDLFVVVNGDRTSARRVITDVVAELRTEQFDGDRYDFEPYVESVESARRAGAKLRDIFEEGITVYGSNQLQSIQKAVLLDE
jgi:predicted nucleotidyltransferase